MECKWGHTDCSTSQNKCWMCIGPDQYYKPKKAKKHSLAKKQPRVTARKGSKFEYNNHQANEDLFSGTTSRMTPNSGAGCIKGDEEISGLLRGIEELKTSNKITSRGKKSFSIQKIWLDKLKKESSRAGKEFWYLKFCFGEDERDWYCILESDMIMSMIYTMAEDRKKVLLAEAKAATAEKRRQLTEAENTMLLAKIELLEAQLKEKELE
jgi:hypothetical protein